MISSQEHFSSVSDNEERSQFSDDEGWGSDFDDPISERFAQEIAENRINEKYEAVFSKIENYENSIMEESSQRSNSINENFETNAASSSGALPKIGFSYLMSNTPSNIKEHQITATRNILQVEHKTSTNDINSKHCESRNLIGNTSHSLESNINFTNQIQEDSNENSQATTDKKTPGKLRPEAFDFLKKLNPSEIAKTDGSNDYLKLENTETLICAPPLPARPPPIFKYPLLGFSKQTADFSQTGLDLISKYTSQSSLDSSNSIENQNEDKSMEKRNVSNEIRSHREDQAQVKLKRQTVEPKSEVIPQPLIKRPTSIPINKSLRNLLENADPNLKNYGSVEIIKIKPELKSNVTKNDRVPPELPKKPDKIRNLLPEQIISTQHKGDIKFPQRKCVSLVETKVIDIPKTIINDCDEFDSPIVDNMKDYPKSRRSLTALPDSSRLDSSTTQITNSPNENQDEKLQLPDFYPLQHAMDRPSLPQKLRSTQRSLSCNSLVQSFKDLSLAIWFPPEKERKNSTANSNIKLPRKIGKENLVISSVCLLTPPVIEEPTVTEEKSLTPMEQASITRNLWYHEVDASEAQRRLLKLDLDGAFLVRPSSRPTSNIHYTVSVVHSGRVLNTHIREKKNGHYAIGKEKDDEKTFASISELIKYYQDVPFEIRPSGSSTTYGICFRITPPR